MKQTQKRNGENMSYDDLRIIMKRREQLRQQNSNTDIIELDYNSYSIYTFLDVSLPKTWIKMDESFIKTKYPNHSDFMEFFTEPGYKADFIIQAAQSISLAENQIETFKDSMKDMIMRLQPANTFYEDGKQETDSLKICWFDFGSFGLNGMIYNLIFFSEIKGYLLTGSFHCEEQKATDWKPIFLKVLKSLNYVEVSDES